MPKLSQPIVSLPPVVFDSSPFLKPILEATRTDNDQSLFSDLEIARRFRPSRINCFLAEYSLLMLGQQPALTFSEVNEFGTQREMAHIERIMREGTGANRQLAIWEQTQDMKAVVEHIVAETYEGLTLAPGAPQLIP